MIKTDSFLRCFSKILHHWCSKLMHKDRFSSFRDSPFRILPHVFTNEFSSLSITGEIKIGSRTKGESETHLEIWDFWFCFDRFGRIRKTFPVNTITGWILTLWFPHQTEIYIVPWAEPQRNYQYSHIWHKSVGRKKKNIMPSVFLRSISFLTLFVVGEWKMLCWSGWSSWQLLCWQHLGEILN